jgi:hypothetical protein
MIEEKLAKLNSQLCINIFINFLMNGRVKPISAGSPGFDFAMSQRNIVIKASTMLLTTGRSA